MPVGLIRDVVSRPNKETDMKHIGITACVLLLMELHAATNPYEDWKKQILDLEDRSSIATKGIPSLVTGGCSRDEWVQQVDFDTTLSLYAQIPQILRDCFLVNASFQERMHFYGECAFLALALNSYDIRIEDIERHIKNVSRIEDDFQETLAVFNAHESNAPCVFDDLTLSAFLNFLRTLQDAYFPIGKLTKKSIECVWISNFITLQSNCVSPDSFPLEEVFACLKRPRSVNQCYNAFFELVSKTV